MRVFRGIFILVLIGLLAACGPAALQNDGVPDQTNSTEGAQQESDLSADQDIGETSAPAQPMPTGTPQLSPTTEEQILIAAPGQNSAVISPFVVEGIAVAPFESLLGVRLTDANGVVLAEAYPQVSAQMGQTGPYRQEIVFGGITEETPGRLAVYSSSPQDGGLVHLNSVVVRLLPGGEAVPGSPVEAQEKIEVLSPAPDEVVSGGQLVVTGNSAYFFEANLSMMLCAEGGSGGPHLICGNAGSVLAEGFAMIDSPDVGIGGQFAGSLQYTVDEETRARLVVYAVSPMDGGIEHLSSVQIILTP
jgi:hypothetical protein